jgi:hypothetical protein
VKPVIYHPEASAELDAAVKRYESLSVGLGESFVDEVEAIVAPAMGLLRLLTSIRRSADMAGSGLRPDGRLPRALRARCTHRQSPTGPATCCHSLPQRKR